MAKGFQWAKALVRPFLSIAYRAKDIIALHVRRGRIKKAVKGRHLGPVSVTPGGLDLEWLAERLPSAGLILEIGANDGTDSLRMLDAFPRASLYCFEPDARASKAWRARVHNDRAHLLELALCDQDEPVTFFSSGGVPPGVNPDEYPDGWHLSGSVRPPTGHLDEHPWCLFESTITVEGRKLDTIVEELLVSSQSNQIDFIWADVQGAERELILGGSKALEKTRYFYTEFSLDELYDNQPSLGEILTLLPNFQVVRVWDHDVLLENSILSQ